MVGFCIRFLVSGSARNPRKICVRLESADRAADAQPIGDRSEPLEVRSTQ